MVKTAEAFLLDKLVQKLLTSFLITSRKDPATEVTYFISKLIKNSLFWF